MTAPGGAVFGKIVAMIVALGLCAAVLLTVRQLRTQASHELAQTRLRIMEQENELRRLKTQIAARVSPEHVKAMAARLGSLKPIMSDLTPAPALSARGPEHAR
jgi:cell division protein FtsL